MPVDGASSYMVGSTDKRYYEKSKIGYRTNYQCLWTGPYYRSKKLSVDSFDHVEVVFRTTNTQNTTNILIDCDYAMNHGGRRRTTAAIVPHRRLRCAQTLANRLCNNAT